MAQHSGHQHHAESEGAAGKRGTTPTKPDAAHPLLLLQRAAGNASVARSIQRLAAPAIDDLSLPIGEEGGQLSDRATSRIEASRGSGSSVDPGMRARLEPALGIDLGHVRVHEGSEADALARGMSARAFTTGSDVFLRSDASTSDDQVMAHELAHVAQQASEPASEGPLMVGGAEDASEDAAHDFAHGLSSGSVDRMPAEE